MQWDVAALHDGADRHAERLLARAALVHAGARALARKQGSFVDDAAMRTDRTIRPKQPFEVLTSGGFFGVNLGKSHDRSSPVTATLSCGAQYVKYIIAHEGR